MLGLFWGVEKVHMCMLFFGGTERAGPCSFIQELVRTSEGRIWYNQFLVRVMSIMSGLS